MRKLLLTTIILTACFLPVRLHAQQTLSAASTDCTVSGACVVVSVGQNAGAATLTISANASSNTIQFEATSDPNATNASGLWVALNATPSNSTTAASSATATGSWQVNPAGYLKIRMRMSTLSSGTTTVNINQSTASARAGGGGGGGAGNLTFTCSTVDAFLYWLTSTTGACDSGITTNTTGQLSATGGFSATADGVHAGYINWVGNTANQAVTANTAGIIGPNLATFTAYALQLPSTGPTTAAPLLSCVTPVSSVSACTFVAASAGISGLTTGFFTKAGSATTVVNSLCDEAITTANTITCTDTAGFAAPKYTATGTTAGFADYPQGTTSTAVAPCNVATSICEQAPTSVTSYLVNKPGVSANGIITNNVAAAVITQGISGDANHSATVTTGSGTSVGSTTLCSSANCPAGTYAVHVYIDITTACGTTGTYVVNLIYTDDQGSKTVPVNINGTGAVPLTGVLTTTSTANFGENSQVIRLTSGNLNYSTTAAACGSAGPMVGKLYLAAVPVM
jgi:hypothetical protein